ncbi:FtsX-like permease family protein [Catenuloplanes sp. NPDC051500]|uniref:FtsX-like permease family protein n=1 Tax=Catenuloplanes sp. NPDC051500 TaxID=3363959 RepID=UPI0037A16790
MRPGAAVRLALAGTRTDTLRVALTGVSAALASVAVLSAATVLSIRGGDAPWYQSDLLQQPGLRPGVAIALLLLCVPVLALAAQCTRLGAPARDRRLAAIRLAGATPAQTLAVVTVEAGLATLIGTLAGLGLFFGGRVVLDRRNAAGELWLPTDVLPPVWVVTAVGLALPAIAMLLGALLLRRVRVTPFGVARQSDRLRTPRTWPALLLVIGVGVAAASGPLASTLDRGVVGRIPAQVILPVLFAVSVGLAVGVIAGTSSISYVVGIVLRRWGRTPAMLLAGSRLMTDPWSGSRVLAALLAAVLVGGVSIGVRAQFAAQYAADVEADRLWMAAVGETMMADPAANDFYMNAMDLVNLAIAMAVGIAAVALLVAAGESLVSRRRAYASLVASGVPRGVIGRSVVWQLFAPAVPSVLISAVVGWLMTRSTGNTVTSGGTNGTICLTEGPVCSDPVLGAPYLREVDLDLIVHAVPVPVEGLLLLTGGALLAVLATVAVSMFFLRASTAADELRAA